MLRGKTKPSTTRMCRSLLVASGVAVGIGGGIATFQMYLVGPQSVELQEELRIEFDPTFGWDVQLGHPTFNAFRIKLLVPGLVKGIGEIHAPAITTDFHHLRPAVQRI